MEDDEVAFDTVTEYLESLVVVALRCGMTYDEYWHGEPDRLTYHYQWYVTAQKERMADMDTLVWMGGQYNQVGNAINLHGFAGGKKHNAPKYPKEPMFYTPLLSDEEKRKRKQRQDNRPVEEQFARFQQVAAAFQHR